MSDTARCVQAEADDAAGDADGDQDAQGQPGQSDDDVEQPIVST